MAVSAELLTLLDWLGYNKQNQYLILNTCRDIDVTERLVDRTTHSTRIPKKKRRHWLN